MLDVLTWVSFVVKNIIFFFSKKKKEVDWLFIGANTNNSKKFAWDLLQAAKSALPAIGPSMGINNREDALKFLEEYKLCLSTTECYICFKAVASKKLR